MALMAIVSYGIFIFTIFLINDILSYQFLIVINHFFA